MTGHFRNKYKIAGPQTWELVRAAYLSGESAQVVAERYGVTVPAIRRRAWKEKWTKRDLAAALEARGIAPPPPPAAPDYIEPHIGRAKERVAAEAERSSELDELVDEIASAEDAADIAAAIERRALAQASAAMVQGRSKEAQALASMAEMMRKRAAAGTAAVAPAVAAAVEPPRASAGVGTSPAELEQRAMAQADAALSEGRAGDAKIYMALADQMRKRAEDESAAEEAEQEAFYAKQSEADEMACFIFTKAAYIANAMVHAPSMAPEAFQALVKLWREHNLGEGEEDAERAAAKLAASQAAYLDGRYEDNLPDYVREQNKKAWARRREDLEGKPPVPQHWAEREAEMRKNGLWTREDD